MVNDRPYTDENTQQTIKTKETNTKVSYAPIYFVWREGTSAPARQHNTAGEAINEAKRLAKKHPTHKFYVVKTLQTIQYRENPFEIVTFSDVPF